MYLTLGRHQWRNALRQLACWKLTGSHAVGLLPKKYIQDYLRHHQVVTTNLQRNDPLKCFLYNPNLIDSSMVRLFNPSLGPLEGTPTEKRIIQDINRCTSEHLLKIIEAKGVIVANLGSRNGHRRGDTGVNRRVGKLTNGSCPSTRWIHPDARPSM